jgi:hypothetical protein
VPQQDALGGHPASNSSRGNRWSIAVVIVWTALAATAVSLAIDVLIGLVISLAGMPIVPSLFVGLVNWRAVVLLILLPIVGLSWVFLRRRHGIKAWPLLVALVLATFNIAVHPLGVSLQLGLLSETGPDEEMSEYVSYLRQLSTNRPNEFGFYTGEPFPARFLQPADQPGIPWMHVVTNSLSYRDEEWSPDAAPGVRRVLLVGDSFVWGYGIPTKEGMLDTFLEHELNRQSGADERWEVINIAISPSALPYYMEGLKVVNRVAGAEVLVMSVLGSSDLLPVDEPMITRNLPGWLVRWLNLGEIVADIHRGLVRYLRACMATDCELYWADLEQAFRLLLDEVQARGAHLIVWDPGETSVPHRFFDPFLSKDNLLFMNWPVDVGLDGSPERCGETNTCSWREDPAYVLLPGKDNHPTPLANEMIARAIAGRILSIPVR